MSNYSVTLGANAGIALRFGQTKLLIDALHSRKTGVFSPVSPAQWEIMQTHEAFSAPDMICFTHCHADHFSEELTAQAMRLWPRTLLLLPETHFQRQYLLLGREGFLSCKDISLRFFKLPHEGHEFAAVPHYGFLISHGDVHILIAGDGEIAGPALAEAITGISIDLALLDFPWLTLRKGRQFIQEHIRPKHLLICHLPFAQDDCMGYRAAAQNSIPRLNVPDIRLLLEPFQTEVYSYS